MNPAISHLELGTHRLLVRRSGQGSPLLLIHGHSLDGRMWTPQLEALGPHFDLIIPDLPGYGGSSKPHPPFSHAEVLVDMLDRLNISQAHLLGLSLGGNIALDLALHAPERVNRVVVAGSSLKGFPLEATYAASMQAIVRHAQQRGVESARALWLAHPLFASLERQPSVRAEVSAWVAGYTGWHWLEDRSPSEGIEDISARLSELPHPTLVLLGEEEIERNRQIALKLAQDIPRAELGVLPHAGHMCNLEVPLDFNNTVLRFLQAGI